MSEIILTGSVAKDENLIPPKEYKLFINGHEASNKDYAEISWSDNINGVSSVFTFSSRVNYNLEKGIKFLLMKDKKEIMRGILLEKTYDKKKIYSYTGFDYGFYLNKNEITRQFKNVKASTAITQLLKSLSIPIGTIENMPIMITGDYRKQAVAAAIQDIIDQVRKKTGTEYYIRVNQGKVNVKKFQKIDVSDSIYFFNETDTIKIIDTLSNYNVTYSLQDLKNKVLITSQNKDSVYILAALSDNESIKRFGLLQTIEQQDKKNKKSNRTIAKNTLSALNKPKETIKFEMLGTDEIQSGVILTFKKEFTGSFLVKSAAHKISSIYNHKVSLEVERYE